ncbi:MAG: hypothetical protein HKN79_12615, partial [Flavobacteriales bacterium]|nr:hypothetical protein [Flavobacteriales bacterium]
GTPDAGGTWTDPMGDVWQEPFSPSNDMTGVYTYSFPAIGTCEASTAEVEVESIPVADAGANSSVVLCSCQETVDLLDLLDGSPQPDGQWTDSEGNVISSDFDPSVGESGQYIYSIQNANCADAATLDLEVIFVGEVGQGAAYTICRSETVDLFDLLTGVFDAGGEWVDPSGSLIPSGTVDSQTALSGAYSYSFPCSACGEEAILDLQFIETPTAQLTGDVVQCLSSPFELLFNSSSSDSFDITIIDGNGNSYDFSNVSDGQLLTFESEVSTVYTLDSATIEGYIGCDPILTSDASYTLNPPPQATLSGEQSICPGQSVSIYPQMEGNGPFLLEILNASSGLTFLTDTLDVGEEFIVYPGVNTDYSIVQIWDSSDSTCTGEGQGIFEVDISAAPMASLIGGDTLCGGEEGTAQILIEGEWDSYDITMEASFGTYGISDVTSGDQVSFPVPNSMIYCLAGVSPAGSTGCEAQLQDTCAYYEVLPDLITYGLSIDCDVQTQQGTVSFIIQGGNGSYSVDGAPISGNEFTSAEMANGSAFSFEVTDEQGCVTIRQGVLECECLYASAGEFTDAGDTLEACIGEDILVDYDDEFETLDNDDIRSFIIHDGSADILGTILIYVDDLTGGIAYTSDLEPGQTYWLTAIVANETSEGQADPNDVCLTSTTGVGILFRPTPTASMQGDAAICAGEEAEFEVELSGTAPWTVDVELDGSPFAQYVTTENPLIITTSTEGTYTLSLLADAHCPGTTEGEVQVSVQDLPVASISGGGSFCEGSGNGPVLEVQGQAPWVVAYTIDGSPQEITIGNSPEVIPVYESGEYTLTGISDANCTASASGTVDVEVIPAPQAVLMSSGPACQGDTVSVDIQLSGSGPWQFSYSHADVLSDTLLTTSDTTLSFTTEGFLQIEYLSDQACQAYAFESDSIILHPLPEFAAGLSDDSICSGEPLLLQIETTVGDVQIVGLSINGDSENIYIDDQWTQTYTPDEIFSVTLGPSTDEETGCQSMETVTLHAEVIAYPVNELAPEIQLCSTDSLWIGIASESNVSYLWQGEAYFQDPNASMTTLSIENTETESISVPIDLTADRHGCMTTSTMIAHVDPLPDPRFSFNPNPVTAINPVINLFNLTEGSNSYLWTLDGDTISQVSTVSWLLEEDLPDEYEICLQATSDLVGCRNTLCKTIEVVGDMAVYIPNAFTPDGDGLNDLFGPEIRNADLNFYSFDIFDRAGSKVFSSNAAREKWNGKEFNSGKRSRNGVYNYIIITRDRFRRDAKVIRGSVMLIR